MSVFAVVYNFYDRYGGKYHVLTKGIQTKITGLRNSDSAQYEYHVLNGKMHREDGPALVITSGTSVTEYWAIHDEIHREDGPAVVDHSQRRYEYYLNGSFMMFSEWVDALDLHGAAITKIMLEYPQSEYNPYLKA